MDNKCGTIHAEVDALLKLKYVKKKEKINIAVFRTNKQGKSLMMSKCCDRCRKSIDLICKKKNYSVQNIYYSDEIGDVQKI